MNILIIGGGGREHALGWKLKQSKRCERLFFAPGNGGTAAIGTNLDLPVEPVNTKNADAVNYFCRQSKIDLIVIGPEDPLAGGLADQLEPRSRRPSRVHLSLPQVGVLEFCCRGHPRAQVACSARGGYQL